MKKSKNAIKRHYSISQFDLKMKLMLTLFLLALFQIKAETGYSQKVRISLDMKSTTIVEIINEIEYKTEFKFFYSKGELNVHQKMDVHVKNERVEKVLDDILKNFNVVYKVVDRHIILTPKKSDFNEPIKKAILTNPQSQITGTIRDKSGAPLPGANIIEKGTTNGAIADFEGHFSMIVSSSGGILIASYLGYTTKEVPLSGQTDLIIVLEENAAGLDEVVVTALGISKEKKRLVSSVQKVDGSELVSSPAPNFLGSLSGKISGVQISNSNGALGSSTRVVIRGNNFLSGNNQPLFVINGVPVDNTYNSGAYQYGGVDYGNAISTIDPELIESISVLKGPSAAALYGSRASNGVVLITTKKTEGTDGDLAISYTSSINFDKAYLFPDYQNEYGSGSYGEYIPDANNWGPKMEGQSVTDGILNPQSNNVEGFFNTGIRYSNTLSLQKSTETTSLGATFIATDQSGIVPNTDQKQYTLNLDGGIKLNKKFALNTNVNLSKLQNNNLPNQGYSGNNVMQTFTFMPRQWDTSLWENYENEDGSQRNDLSTNQNNPLWIYNNNTNSRDRLRIISNITANYEIIPGLSLVGRLGFDRYDEQRKSIIKATTIGYPTGAFSSSKYFSQEINGDLFMQYNKKVGTAVEVTGLFGSSISNRKFESESIGNPVRLSVPGIYNVSNASGTPSISQYFSEKEIQSIYGQFSFSFFDTYLLEVTGRNDWSSTLPSNNRSYFYPSISGGVIFSNLLGISSDILSFGKIRANWAQVGNDTSAYSLNSIFDSGGAQYAGISMFSYGNLLNNGSLKPEISESREVGLELNLLNNRVKTEIVTYKTSSRNQILSAPVSRTTGVSNIKINAGEIENKGIEVSLEVTPIRSHDFSWTSSFNWSKNQSKVVELYPGVESLVIGNLWGVPSKAVPDEEYGMLYGTGFLKDENGNQVIGSNGLPARTTEQVKLGGVNPDWIGGINNRFIYKNFELSFLLDFKQGGHTYNLGHRFNVMAGSITETTANNIRANSFVLDGVKEDGTPNDIEIEAQDYFGPSGLTGIQEYSVFDTSFIKLRELSLYYRISGKELKNLNFIKSASIGMFGQNLWLIHSNMPRGFDPESATGASDSGMGLSYTNVPIYRTYGMRLQFNF